MVGAAVAAEGGFVMKDTLDEANGFNNVKATFFFASAATSVCRREDRLSSVAATSSNMERETNQRWTLGKTMNNPDYLDEHLAAVRLER